MIENKPLTMTIEEVSDLTGFKLNQCYQLMKVEDIPAKKIGKEWKILRSQFPGWFENYMNGSSNDFEKGGNSCK